MDTLIVLKRIYLRISCDARMQISTISFLVPYTYLMLLSDLTKIYSTICYIFLLLLLCCLLCLRNFKLLIKFMLQGYLLGLVCGIPLSLLVQFPSEFRFQTVIFFVYLQVLALFHFFEFFVTGLTNPSSLSCDSFLLNHSLEYWVAAVCAWAEHFIESLFFDFYCPVISILGLIMCMGGEILRKLAMCHASVGFTHQIAMLRHRHHILVTTGIYGFFRHPGYLGWLLWSLGTQLILCNPICICVYALVSYNFFYYRIAEEEKYLIEFFGQRYISYARRVPSGIPGTGLKNP